MRFILGGVLGLVVASAACGDDGLAPAPDTLTAGPVTIDTRTMPLTLGSSPALAQPQFLSIGTADPVEEAHYDDPRGDDLVTLGRIAKATGLDGGWVVLDGGTRIQLTECPIASCAILDIVNAGSVTALEACAAPGCWYFDATAQRFQARVFAGNSETHTLAVDGSARTVPVGGFSESVSPETLVHRDDEIARIAQDEDEHDEVLDDVEAEREQEHRDRVPPARVLAPGGDEENRPPLPEEHPAGCRVQHVERVGDPGRRAVLGERAAAHVEIRLRGAAP